MKNADNIKKLENKETFTKEEVIEMLNDMQMETANCCGFIVGNVSQLWVIKDMLGKRIEALGGESIQVVIS